MKKAPMLVGCSSLVRSVRAVLGISSPVFSFQEPGREDEEPSPNHPEEQKDAKATKYHPQTVQHALLQRTPARTNMALWADIKLTARQKEGLGGAHAFLANGVMADPLWRRSCADVQFGLECSGDRGLGGGRRSRQGAPQRRAPLHPCWREAARVLVRLRHDREHSKRNNWLLIKRQDGYEREGNGEDILEEDRSIASNRSMEAIAAGKKCAGKGSSFKANAIWRSNRNGGEEARAAVAGPARQKSVRSPRKGASSMPPFIPPQLCKRVGRPPSGGDWVHEIKLDGYRTQLRVEDGEAVMRTRKGLD